MKDWAPSSITTDRLASYPKAIRRLKRAGKPADAVRHRTSKDLDNLIKADHGALKPMIRRVRGFKTMRTASATIKGFEIMRMIRRGHCMPKQPGAKGEVRFVNNLFSIAA